MTEVTGQSETDLSQAGWSDNLRAHGKRHLADVYDIDIRRDFELLYKIGLPTLDAHLMPVVDFLEGGDLPQETFRHDQYYLVLLPRYQNLRKYSLMGFRALEEARNFVTEKIAGFYDKYLIRISEFEENVYGGSVMSNDGILIVEMAKGLQIGVAYGTDNVITGRLTPIKPSVQYSTDNRLERHLIWHVIKVLMRDSCTIAIDLLEHREIHRIRDFFFLKGYFEFAYTRRVSRNTLRLVFFDIKLGKVFYNVSP